MRLSEEKEDANQNGNFDKAEQIEHEIEEIRQYLKDAKYKTTDPVVDRRRISVRNAIQDAKRRIGEYDSGFATYLDDKIDTGIICMYKKNPDDPTKWQFQSCNIGLNIVHPNVSLDTVGIEWKVLGAVHNLQPDVPTENILAMYRHAREYVPSFT